MRPLPTSWFARSALALCVLPSLAGLAKADSEPGPLLLVGVTRATASGAKADSRLSRALTDHLAHNGEAMVRASLLTSSERLCADQDCLQILGERTSADLVMTARVDERAPGIVTIRVALLDVDRRAPRELEGVCEPCSATDLGSQLGGLSLRILREHRAQPAQPVAAHTPEPPVVPVVPIIPVETTAPAAAPEPAVRASASATPNLAVPPAAVTEPEKAVRPSLSLSTLPTWRKATAAGLGAAAIATLIPSIVLSALEGRAAPSGCGIPGMREKCVYMNAPLYGTGYALSALLTVGVGLTLFLPDRSRESAPRVAVTPFLPNASSLTLTE